jgi:Autotransporter beta-domain
MQCKSLPRRAGRMFAWAPVLSAAVAVSTASALAAGGNFFDDVRAAAGADKLITKTEFLALLPPPSQGGPTQAFLDTFFARANTYGVSDASGNLKIEGLVNLIIAAKSTNLVGYMRFGPAPAVTITLTDIAAALPRGLSQSEVQDFLLSIPRSPGGLITRAAAEKAIYDFVGRDGHKGQGELNKFVYKVFGEPFDPRDLPVIKTEFGSAPITLKSTGNIFAPGTAIFAQAGFGGCDYLGKNCIPPTGGSVSITNLGTLVSIHPGFQGITEGVVDASSTGGSIAIVNKGMIGLVGDEGKGIGAHTANYSNGYSSNGPSVITTGKISIENQGLIQTDGDDSTGISTENNGSGATAIVNSGAILSLGAGSQGIQAESGARFDPITGTFPNIDGGLDIKNSGLIEMGGPGSEGIATHTIHGLNSVENTGRIAAAGKGSAGITATTNLGTVRVRSSGDVIASAADSYGIVAAQLFGKGLSDPVESDQPIRVPTIAGDKPLAIEITGGTVQGGSGGRSFGFATDGSGNPTGSAGVLVFGGKNNTISNAGTITALNGLAISVFDGDLIQHGQIYGHAPDGHLVLKPQDYTFAIAAADMAITNTSGGKILGDIVTGGGKDSVDNSGRIDGSIDLGGGGNAISNLSGGIFNSADDIKVGTGNTFSNAGDLSPGGNGKIQTTTIVGNFIQTVNGRLLIDIKDSGTALASDMIEVTGRATLAGVVVPHIINIRDAEKNEYLIVDTTAGATSNGLAVNPNSISVNGTVAYDFDVAVRNGKHVYLVATQNSVEKIVAAASGASNAGNTGNLTSLGQTLSQSQHAPGAPLGAVMQGIRQVSTTPEAAANALNRLTPQQQSGQTNSTNIANTGFSNAMLSCASREEPYRFTKEETCYYAKFTARELNRDATNASAGHDERGYEVMGGTQVNLGGDVRGGVAFGYEETNGDTFSASQRLGSTDGNRVHAGVVLKNQWGPVNAYLNLAGSYGWYDHKRFVNLGGFTNALSEQEVASGLAKLRLSYLNDMGTSSGGSWYIKPLVDFGATYIDLGGYSETGAGAFNLKVASKSQWLFSVSPALEIGGEIAGSDGTLYRPYIRGGVTVFDKDDLTYSANFAGAPVGVTGFTLKSELDNVFADAAAGIQVLTASGTNLKFEYDGRFGEHSMQNAGTVKITVPY